MNEHEPTWAQQARNLGLKVEEGRRGVIIISKPDGSQSLFHEDGTAAASEPVVAEVPEPADAAAPEPADVDDG